MKAIARVSFGPPASPQLRDLTWPMAAARQVLARTRVAAVNFPDAP